MEKEALVDADYAHGIAENIHQINSLYYIETRVAKWGEKWCRMALLSQWIEPYLKPFLPLLEIYKPVNSPCGSGLMSWGFLLSCILMDTEPFNETWKHLTRDK